MSSTDLIELAAKTAHEVNRAYCAAHNDLSQRPWADAPDWQKASAMAGVRAIAENPATTPRQSHENWLAHKKADGWKYGPIKDEAKREHPCFVPYDDLPAEQQVKDHLFGAAVRAVLGVGQ